MINDEMKNMKEVFEEFSTRCDNVIKFCDNFREMDINMKNYCIRLHAVGRKNKQGFQGFDEATAYFSTSAKVDSVEWEECKMEAVDECWSQQKRWWQGYRLGIVKVEVGQKPVDVMSPAYDYHKGRSFPVWKKI